MPEQIELWEQERARFTIQPAYLLSAFATQEEYAKVPQWACRCQKRDSALNQTLKAAKDANALLWEQQKRESKDRCVHVRPYVRACVPHDSVRVSRSPLSAGLPSRAMDGRRSNHYALVNADL